jgi:hypothetical protein
VRDSAGTDSRTRTTPPASSPAPNQARLYSPALADPAAAVAMPAPSTTALRAISRQEIDRAAALARARHSMQPQPPGRPLIRA